MQQARIDEMNAQDALNAVAWNAPEPEHEQLQENGWRMWPVVPPPYTSFSFRNFRQIQLASMHVGVVVGSHDTWDCTLGRYSSKKFYEHCIKEIGGD